MWERRLTQGDKVDRAKVVQLRDAGLTGTAIAKRLCCNPGTVSRILTEAGKPPQRGGFGVRAGFNEL